MQAILPAAGRILAWSPRYAASVLGLFCCGFRTSDLILRTLDRVEQKNQTRLAGALDRGRAVQQAGFSAFGPERPAQDDRHAGRQGEDTARVGPVGRDAVLRAGAVIRCRRAVRVTASMWNLRQAFVVTASRRRRNQRAPISPARMPASAAMSSTSRSRCAQAGVPLIWNISREVSRTASGRRMTRAHGSSSGSSASIQRWNSVRGCRCQIAAAQPGRWIIDRASGVSVTPTPMAASRTISRRSVMPLLRFARPRTDPADRARCQTPARDAPA